MEVIHKPQVRFNDVDLVGHVHNAQFIVFFEEARIQWFKTVIGNWDWSNIGLVVARNEIDYLAPIFLQDDVHTACKLESIGNKSFVLTYRMFKVEDGKEIDCAKGKSVTVCINYKTQQTHPIPEEWREKFEQCLG